MTDRIQHEMLNYSCTFKDIRDINCSELLASNKNPDDAMLSILCSMDDTIATLVAIRERFMLLPEKEQKDYLVGLKNLARLRGLTSLVKKEVEDKMPVTIDISNDETFLAGKREGLLEGEKRGLQEGKQEGKLEGILEGIEVALDIKYGSEGLFLMDDIRKIGTIEKLEAFKEEVRKASSVNKLMRFLMG
ncbi:MAG: Yae1 family protein [Nitrospirae bacterium]|nr:Yae1 family protein [Nitrospirota bacterium]